MPFWDAFAFLTERTFLVVIKRIVYYRIGLSGICKIQFKGNCHVLLKTKQTNLSKGKKIFQQKGRILQIKFSVRLTAYTLPKKMWCKLPYERQMKFLHRHHAVYPQFQINAIIYPKKKQKEHMVAFIKAYLDASCKQYTTV